MSEPELFDPFQNLVALGTIESARNSVQRLLEQFEQGHGKSGYMLALLFTPGILGVPDDVQADLGVSYEKASEYYERAYSRLLQEAQAGEPEAMYLIGLYFQSGTPPVQNDYKQYEHWKNKAIQAGYRGGGQL